MELRPLYVGGFAVGTTLALLLLLRILQRRATPEHEGDDENPARALLHAGQLLGVFFVSAAAVKNCVIGTGFLRDALWVGAFALAALGLLAVTGRLGVQLLLRSSLAEEIERKNSAVGLAAGAHFAACGIVTAQSFAGHDARALGLSLVFFTLAQFTLLGFVTLFRALTVYDDAEEIRGENVAAALSYGGLAVAVAIIVGRALDGDFAGWSVSLRAYAGALPWVFLLYPVRQFFVQTLLLGGKFTLRGGRLDDAIRGRRSAGMGALEAASYVATALAVSHLYA